MPIAGLGSRLFFELYRTFHVSIKNLGRHKCKYYTMGCQLDTQECVTMNQSYAGCNTKPTTVCELSRHFSPHALLCNYCTCQRRSPNQWNSPCHQTLDLRQHKETISESPETPRGFSIPNSPFSFVYHMAKPSPNRFFPRPWTLKCNTTSQLWIWNGWGKEDTLTTSDHKFIAMYIHVYTCTGVKLTLTAALHQTATSVF